MIGWIRFLLTALLVAAGLIVCCIGVYGMFRFKYAANRMHAAATVDTMGISLCLLGLAISAPDFFSAMKILLVVVFWWISSPVASHLLCRLEIMTDEQRGQYMNVHQTPLAAHSGAAQDCRDGESAGGAGEEPQVHSAKEEQA